MKILAAVALAGGAAAVVGAASPRVIRLPATTPRVVVVTDGEVRSIVVAGDTAYVAGWMNYAGPRTGAFSVLRSGSTRAASGWPRIFGRGSDHSVQDAIPDGAGGWLVAGTFATVGGRACTGFARISGAYRVDPRFCHFPDGAVEAIVRQGPTIFLGGRFQRIDGKPRSRLAAIDLRSGRLLPWHVTVSGGGTDRGHPVPGYVDALALDGSRLLVGGLFRRVANASRECLAQVDTRTGRLSSWRAGTGPPGDSCVTALAVRKGTVFVAGHFSSLAGKPARGIGAVSSTTGRRTAWNPLISEDELWGDVRSLLIAGERVVLGGRFSSVGGARRDGVAVVDAPRGALVKEFNPPGIHGDVNALASSAGVIYIGGYFDRVGSSDRGNLAALDARTGRLRSWAPLTNAEVFVVRTTEGAIAVGGRLTSIGGARRDGLAAINAKTGAVLPWAPRFGPGVEAVPAALALAGGRLYVGGSFAAVNGVHRNGLAAFDVATRRLTGWAPSVGPPDDDLVQGLAASDNTVFAAGEFHSANAIPRQRIAAFDAQSGALRDWNPGLAGDYSGGRFDLKALDAAGGRVYVAGDGLVEAQGTRLTGFADIDAATAQVAAWTPVRDGLGTITAARRIGGTVYLGGNFDHFEGAARNGIEALEARTRATLPWAPQLGPAYGFALVGDALAVVGGFRPIPVALVDTQTGATLPWRPAAAEMPANWWMSNHVGASETTLAFSTVENANVIRVYRITGTKN